MSACSSVSIVVMGRERKRSPVRVADIEKRMPLMCRCSSLIAWLVVSVMPSAAFLLSDSS